VGTVRTVKLSARIAQHVVFRAAVAFLFLAIHLSAMMRFAWTHFDTPFNNAPNDPPSFVVADYSFGALNWNRLVVSRWDSGQYIAMSLDDIYGHCPTADLRGADLAALNPSCDLPFFPAYAILGWLASWGARYPVDYALLAVSLVASFFLLFLWTGPVIVKALGLWGTYCSLLLFNVYTTGFTLVTVLTEPCTMVFTFAALIFIGKRRFWLAALFAGAASGMRVSGACASVAFVAALLMKAWDSEELSVKDWLKVVVLMPLSAWGLLTMMGYDWWRFSDPLIYMHAHAQAFAHDPKLWHIFWPDPAWVVRSMGAGVHDVAIAALMALWFALGHREGLRGFSRPGQAFLYVHTVVAFCLPIYGTAELGYTGVTRYLFLLFGVFFSMAAVLKRRPIALFVWCALSGWHYWNADLCYYISHAQNQDMAQCLLESKHVEAPAVAPRSSIFSPGGAFRTLSLPRP
jgi:hypothetical protein